jgi:hypothetical protein
LPEGRAHAVAEIKGLQTSGLLAWVIWVSLHIFYLIGVQNQLLVLAGWAFSIVTRGRGARLITGSAAGLQTQRRPGIRHSPGRDDHRCYSRPAAP